MVSRPESRPGSSSLDVTAVARALERWLRENRYTSYDPYDGLMSPWMHPVRRHRLLARVCTQVVKRSPVNLRPLLGIRPGLYTKSLSDLASAYLLLHRLEGRGADLERARDCLEALRRRTLQGFPGACWGMDLYYVSRSAMASPETPNLFQTVSAAAAFLDAYESFREPRDLQLATGVVEFLERGLGRLEDREGRLAWRYYPGVDTCVYNVNALAGALLLRLATHTERTDFLHLGRRTLAFVLSEQNADGSWFYSRGPEGRWVDGFHTGYVLEALMQAARIDPESGVAPVLHRGSEFYLRELFTADHVPRYTNRNTFPIEVQNCAQAIQTLAHLAGRDPGLLQRACAVTNRVVRDLFVVTRRGPEAEGYFVMSRGRFLTNRMAAVRWGQAPMLMALASLLEATRTGAGSDPA